ncbi:peptidylprolyl isomerase [Lysinibacter sp. HNR]|uniref:peptidylprolyl isomerase n=1 Tax=Lysinibacter sp. HNR TaxID=3031408 RepID=UPI002435C90C|nr:peptidylprolyl isomerase [Lysinibacter sp. HNR]WGD36300.1 peptidylprolyl isomerase [Lysinibacter sp. HNR]
MAHNKSKREERLHRERLRSYEARKTVHQEGAARRKRDNILWAIAGTLVVALAVFGQIAYLNANPSTPAASPTTAPPEGESNQGDVPDPALAESREWTGNLVINDIDLKVKLDGVAAPQAVASTIALANDGFYNETSCHRLTTEGIYVLQCGSPDGTGTDGPGYSYGPVENVPADNFYQAGTIAMARADSEYSHGSQFFIVYEDSTIGTAESGYTVIGSITSGIEELRAKITSEGTADGSTDGSPKVPAIIKSFRLE